MARHRRNRTENITEAVLAEMDRALDDFCEAFVRVFGDVVRGSKDSWPGTIKWHSMQHGTSIIRDLGHPREYASNFLEAGHKRPKQLYKATSRRHASFLREMVRSQLGPIFGVCQGCTCVF